MKITEVIVEPSPVRVGSTFKLKIKATRYATYNEVRDKLDYSTLRVYTYNQLKGE